MKDVWAAGEAYEPYVGRWSRLVADEFVPWLDLAAGSHTLDVGCGTGALTSSLSSVGPATGVDPSAGFVAHARRHCPGAVFVVGDAMSLPFAQDAFDATASGLVLNFVPDPRVMVAEMTRVVRPGGVVALYVWDYAEGMELMRRFWDVAAQLDQSAPDEAERFPVCAPDPLAELLEDSDLTDVTGRAVVVATTFADFDDYWLPFLMGQGPAPAYVATLEETQKRRLRDRLHETLPFEADGSLRLTARAWGVKGRVG